MNINTKKRKSVLLGIALFFVVSLAVVGVSALAQSDLDQPFGKQDSIATLTQAIFQFAIAACVLAACIYIAIGAFYYFAAAGGDAKRASEGKEKIQNAIIGLVLALVSWLILNTIHPQFTQLQITPLEQKK